MTLLLSGCFLLLTLGQCVLGQSPDRLCREDFRYVDDHNYPDDWHLIVDSYDYENLFGGTSGVWELRDVDRTGGQWGDNFGGSCQLEIGACSFRAPNQNNWFFTDHNSYGEAIEVFVSAIFRWSRCTSNQNCKNDFVTLYRYDTNTIVSTSKQTDPENYHPITGNNLTSVLQQGPQSGDTMVELRFNRPSKFNGLYLGFRDTGTCGQIKRFQVYYRIAPPVDVGLLSCPEVPLVTGDTNSADCSCAENSSPIGDLKRTCFDDGVCSDLAMCKCDCGYQITSTGKQCIACETGFYRTLANSMTKCIKCPLNTNEDQPQTCQCECLPRHFRAKDEGPDDGCTSVPDACTELEAESVGSESLTLKWKRPNATGDDVYWYTILRSDQRNIGDFQVIVERMEDYNDYVVHEFTDLTPFTSYVFRVVVQNKVTCQDPDNEHLRICDVKLTTMEGVPGPPRIVRAFCTEIVWGSPFNPNGEVKGYVLEFYDYQNPSINNNMLKNGQEHSHIVDENNDLPQDVESSQVYVKVRAKTSTQDGEWSKGRPLGCPTCKIGVQCPSTDGTSCTLNPTPDPDVQCPKLRCPDNGEVDQTENPFTATYSCDSQYQLVGDVTRTCQSDGTWSGSEPFCVATDSDVQCMLLAAPANGRVTQSGRGVGSSATYTCVSGYQLVGASNRVCQLDGTWSGDRPACQVSCGALLSPVNGVVTQTGTTFGHAATYSCNPGYTIVGATTTRVCNGTWTGVAPTCSQTCDVLPNPTNGLVTITRLESPGILPGSQAVYTCNGGYEINGNSIHDCQSDGTWSGSEPSCVATDNDVQCMLLAAPSNGRVTQSGRGVGISATYTCNIGYQLVGTSNPVCQPDGTWSGDRPACRISCGALLTPVNGVVTQTGTTFGHAATYSCNPGYTIVGATTTRVCNGTWTGVAPTCEPPPLRFELNGTVYANGSMIQASEIGNSEECLRCITDKTDCCRSPNRAGQYSYPDGLQVRTQGAGDPLYRGRGVQHICLHRRGTDSIPLGTYCCNIPDSNGVDQKIYITIK